MAEKKTYFTRFDFRVSNREGKRLDLAVGFLPEVYFEDWPPCLGSARDISHLLEQVVADMFVCDKQLYIETCNGSYQFIPLDGIGLLATLKTPHVSKKKQTTLI